MAVRTVAELATLANNDPAVAAELKADPAAAMAKYAYTSDPKFYRIAIGGLIGIIVLVILSALLVQLTDSGALPDWISALATTALGGLVGLFAPSPTSSGS